MRRILSLTMLIFISLSAVQASKVIPRPFKVTLKDGRTVTITQHGDEYGVFYFTNSGEQVIKDKTNRWRIATKAEKVELFSMAAERRALNQKSFSPSKSVGTFALGSPQMPNVYKPFPHVGNPKALVIMVEFTDRKFSYGKAELNKWLNTDEYNTTDTWASYSSVAQYFNDCSNGKFRPVFDIAGPFTMPKASTYYGANKNGVDDPDRYKELIREACTHAMNSGINLKDYDADKDGYIDLVYVFYAGFGEQWGDMNENYIWAKSGIYESGPYNGVKTYRYGMSNELVGWETIIKDMQLDWDKIKLNGTGVFLHEMCHTLGLPDVYPTAKWNDVSMYDDQSMEEWDLMDAGENIKNGYWPAPLSAWERVWMGWDEIEDITEGGTYTIKGLHDNNGKAYRLKNPHDKTGNEFYILESIPTGKSYGWYRYMPNRGMLVTHINYDNTKFSNFNQPNNEQGKPRWTIVPANGKVMSGYRYDGSDSSYNTLRKNLLGHVYPGNTTKEAQSFAIDPVTTLTNWKEYSKTLQHQLRDITQVDNSTVSFTIVMDPTGIDQNVVDVNSVSDNRIFTVNGQFVGKDAARLPADIYIRNGKKLVLR